VYDKEILRKQLLAIRLSISRAAVIDMSRLICDKLDSLISLTNIYSVHYFEPIFSMKEVDIFPYIDTIRLKYPKILLHTTRRLNNRWCNIDTYSGQELAMLPVYDLVIVPMLGFDLDMHRIGYGGGFYDRLLLSQPSAFKVGVCFEICKVDKIKYESHDVILDKIVTEFTEYSM
jgi:5-formyltetrahydrofolate cyclo-ligase